uniref:Oxidative stress-responsive serine-rich protein 1 n=1 Tax=Amphilophus citrinellus TaxID=61819 RepID=A0A3Q0SHA8_AMPCI
MDNCRGKDSTAWRMIWFLICAFISFFLSSPFSCMRKTSRGASRTQRRRRSKSPILHPPKFTYCSSSAASALSPPSGCPKHQRLAVPEPGPPHPALDGITASPVAIQKERASSGSPGHFPPLVFGSCAGYDMHIRGVASSQELPAVITATSGGKSTEGPHTVCSCAQRSSLELQEEAKQGAECQCHHQGWNGVEVYSFTGLRNVISECERNLPNSDDPARTLNCNAATASSSPALSSGSPRSCSEQARAYVDDITIEDLSGYMEYYLYIPKKMSHMAEMMYT